MQDFAAGVGQLSKRGVSMGNQVQAGTLASSSAPLGFSGKPIEVGEGLEEAPSFVERGQPVGKEGVFRRLPSRRVGLDGWPLDM